MNVCKLMNELNVGINFFGLVAGVFSIISLFLAIKSINETKEYQKIVLTEESSRFYYEKRIKLYENIKFMFREYFVAFGSKKYKDAIEKLNGGFDSVITGLMTLFSKEYVIKFQRIYDIAVSNLNRMIHNDAIFKNTNGVMNDVSKLLEKKPAGYFVSIPEPEKLDEIDWNLDEEVYKFEQGLIEYINLKSKAIDK